MREGERPAAGGAHRDGYGPAQHPQPGDRRIQVSDIRRRPAKSTNCRHADCAPNPVVASADRIVFRLSSKRKRTILRSDAAQRPS